MGETAEKSLSTCCIEPFNCNGDQRLTLQPGRSREALPAATSQFKSIPFSLSTVIVDRRAFFGLVEGQPPSDRADRSATEYPICFPEASLHHCLASLVPRSSRRPPPGTPTYLTHGARLGPEGETWRQRRQRGCRPTRTMSSLAIAPPQHLWLLPTAHPWACAAAGGSVGVEGGGA